MRGEVNHFGVDAKIYFVYTSSMQTPRKRGRPPDYEGEIMVKRMYRWPPSLQQELERLVPAQQRSAFVRAAVERALASRRRQVERAAARGNQE
jgi:hypothetical protein